MSDQQEPPTQTPEVIEADALAPEPETIEHETETTPDADSRKWARAALVISLVALASVGAGGWIAGQQVADAQSDQGQLAVQVLALQAQVANLESATAAVSELQTNLARVDTAQQQVLDAAAQAVGVSDAVQGQLKTFVDDLADTRTRVELIEGNRAQEYLLAEVEYLLRIAIQRIQAGGDVGTGLALMQSADQTLANADDAALFPVRRALAGELAALNAIPKVDRNGLYLALAAAADQVDVLSMAPSVVERAEAPEATGAEGMLKTLSSFITIRQRAEPIQPMLSPAEEVYARQNLRLMIEQAQLAILAKNAMAWQSSLQRASAWTDANFLANDATTQSLIATFERLSGQPIAPELPPVGASLAALKQVQKARDAALGGN